MNVATYGRGGRWTMTDRGQAALGVSARRLQIGPSAMVWDGTRLTIEVDERTWPHMGRLRGEIVLTPEAVTPVELPLVGDGSHVWRPFAPAARIAVRLGRDGWSWDGHGYFDANFGTAALETDFRHWSWGRFPTPGGATVFYDAARADGSELSVAVRFRGAAAEVVEPPPQARLPRSLWAVRRRTRADPGYRPVQVRAMLDAPFYCRSAVRTRIDGTETEGVHESLDLRRFASPLLKPMLAVKVPRRAGWP